MFLSGSAYGGLSHPKLTFSQKIKLHAGVNKLALLSVAVGLPVSSSWDTLSLLKDRLRFLSFVVFGLFSERRSTL